MRLPVCAGLAAASSRIGRGARDGGAGLVLPRWLRVTALLLAAALAVSGYGYLTLTNALAWTAFVSGVLLLLWVTGTGIALTVRRRALPANRPAVSRNSRPSLPAPETPAR
jgi:hypothetical protein